MLEKGSEVYGSMRLRQMAGTQLASPGIVQVVGEHSDTTEKL